MKLTEKDIKLQAKMDDILEKYPIDEAKARELLKLDVSPSQIWILYDKMRKLKKYAYAYDTDIYNIITFFIERNWNLDPEDRENILESRVDRVLRKLEEMNAKREKEAKAKPDSTIEMLEGTLDTARHTFETTPSSDLDARVNQIEAQYAELESLDADTAKCKRIIGICNEIIGVFEERISLNDQKREQIQKVIK